jgi:hypothetical protein
MYYLKGFGTFVKGAEFIIIENSINHHYCHDLNIPIGPNKEWLNQKKIGTQRKISMLNGSIIQGLYEDRLDHSEEADRIIRECIPFFSGPLSASSRDLDHALACLIRDPGTWVFLEFVVRCYPHVSLALRMPVLGLPDGVRELAGLLSVPTVRNALFAPRGDWETPLPIKIARGSFRRSEVIIGVLLSAWLSGEEFPNDLNVWLHRNSYTALGYGCALAGVSQEHIPEEFRMDLESVKKRHEVVSLGLRMSLERVRDG